MHRHKRIARFFLTTLAVIAALAVMAGNALLIWVATGPRSLDRLTPYIESAFNTESSDYRVKIGQTWLLWDGWQHPVDIRLREVSVLTKDGEPFSNFPEIAVGVHIPSLLAGKILPASLAIDRPVISLLQAEDGSVSFGFQQPANPEEKSFGRLSSAAIAAPFAENMEKGILRKLRRVRISNADVSVGSPSKGVFFNAKEVSITAKRRRGVMQLMVGGKLRYGDYQSSISSHFTMRHDQPLIEGVVEFKGMEFSTLASVFDFNSDAMPLNLPVSGISHLSIDKEGKLEQLRFNIDGGMGTLNLKQLAAPVAVGWLHAQGQVSNNMKDIQIDQLSGDLDGMQLALKGVVMLKENDAAIRLEGGLKNVPTEKVATVWPPAFSPLSREWVTTNITGGVVPEATIRTNIQFGDLQKPVLPKESIDARIALEGASIRYLPEHPHAEQVKAMIHIDGETLDAVIESAHYMSDSRLSVGNLLIEDLNADNPYIRIGFDAQASARDVARFLALPRLGHAARLNLNPAQAEGGIKGKASIGFYFFAPRDIEGNSVGDLEVDYQVAAEMSGVSHPGFMKKFDIVNASGALEINNKELNYKGKGEINGASASAINVRYAYVPEGGFDTFIIAEGVADKKALARFGYGNLNFIDGAMGIKVDAKLGAAAEIASAAVDLTQTSIDAKAINWSKPMAQPAMLDIAIEKKNGMTRISGFNLKAQEMEAKGSMEFNADMTEVRRLTMEKLHLGRTRLNTLNYEALNDGLTLAVAGTSADLSGYLVGNDQQENRFSFEQFPALKLSLDVETLHMAGGQDLTHVKGGLFCSALRCEQADINGLSAGKPFHLRILRNPKSKRQFSLYAQDGGNFLKAVDVYDRMEGGELSITGNFDDTAKDSVLRARLIIGEHNIKKAPVLAKILSLASLTGFIDVLEGNGIRFKKMIIPFTLQNDVITVKKARAYGSAIGLTAEGAVTFPQILFDIKGTVVPAYTANTILGKLPILGDILTGGGDGKGIFAANYRVQGTYQNPDVSVNPLSILTPGFLRGIFDAGEGE